MNIKYVKRTLFGLVMLYCVIFILRAAYDIVNFSENDIIDNYNVYFQAEKEIRTVSNYASERMTYTADGAAAAAVLDQKYERIANIVSKTVNYDTDMESFNYILGEHSAVVQMENRRGLAGSRRVDLTIGVRPEFFDSMQAALSLIGAVVSTSVTKTDKTYEYRQMLAEKDTLERRRESYVELKKYGGNIPDLIQLEDKIIEVETQIQQQLIGLGEYSDDNALCTINYTLYEGSEAGFLRKIWNALIWTTSTYFIIIGIIAVTSLTALLLTWCWTKLKTILAAPPNP